MLIKAHQDVSYEKNIRKDTSSTTISRNNGKQPNDHSFGQISSDNLGKDQESMVNFEQLNKSIEFDDDKTPPSLNYIHNALNQITEEEKKKSLK